MGVIRDKLTRLAPGFLLVLAACAAPAPLVPSAPVGFSALWPVPANEGALIHAAGLDDLTTGDRRNIAWLLHLDVFKDGRPVAVPGNLGIDWTVGFTAPVHTHLADGYVNVESPVVRPFTLGQLFTLWGVPLTGATVYVNGTAASDPAAVVLADHQEIVVVFGPPPTSLPSTYPTPPSA